MDYNASGQWGAQYNLRMKLIKFIWAYDYYHLIYIMRIRGQRLIRIESKDMFFL